MTTLATYSLSVLDHTYEGTASIRDDYFDGWFSSYENEEVLAEIISDESLPISTSEITDWSLTAKS